MSSGFYERLGVEAEATAAQVEEAYHRGLARLVARLRTAVRKGADTAALEVQRLQLIEAYEVLNDPARRRRYDRMLSLDGRELPGSPEAFWEQVWPGLVPPAATAAVELIRALTSLPVGPQVGEVPVAAAAAEPAAVRSALSDAERGERGRRAVAVDVEVSPLDPDGLTEPAARVVVTPEAAAAAARAVQPRGPPLSPATVAELVDTFGYSGHLLHAVREAREITVEELSAATRIASRYIEALEANAFHQLPSAVFVKGYVREMAAFLEVPPVPVVQGYMALFKRARGG